jgi:hypothetical protein
MNSSSEITQGLLAERTLTGVKVFTHDTGRSVSQPIIVISVGEPSRAPSSLGTSWKSTTGAGQAFFDVPYHSISTAAGESESYTAAISGSSFLHSPVIFANLPAITFNAALAPWVEAALNEIDCNYSPLC